MFEEISPPKLPPAQRRRIVASIAAAVHRTVEHPTPRNLPEYPQAVPELDAHIDELVRIVRRSETLARATDAVINICPACPHQFPSRYCPLRPAGGCVLRRCASAVVLAVVAVLDEREPDTK